MTEISSKWAGQKLKPTSRFKYGPYSIKSRTISDFWQWAYSDLMQNIERGVLAEYIVAVLLGVNEKTRIPWTAYDLKLSNGATVEVKAMSQLQAWYQRKLSNPRVVIKPTRKWNPETNIMEKDPKFHADLYVICYFKANCHESADPLNLAQWEFYAFNQKQVEKLLEGRKSISLKFLRNSGYKPVTAYKLRQKVTELCNNV
ncbi:MAG: hypothetical protein OEY81_01410 [Candidatus Bathyarchaeota archaeon]|nr:hypothetical protein [Candidatus Bathyarchaeota archaeon]